MTRLLTFAVFTIMITVPLLTSAQQFSRQGIFGCSRNAAALNGSVGSFSATGGVYVPVADYTVELNTGTLVYQQCVLRGIVDRESESANAASIKQRITFITIGRDGNAMFESDRRQETLDESDRVLLIAAQNVQKMNDSVTKATGGALVQSLARSYTSDRKPLQALACPYQVNLPDCWSGANDGDQCRAALADSRCNPMNAYFYRKEYAYTQIAIAQQNRQDCLNWGRGFYCVDKIDSNGTRVTQTPSSIVEEEAVQALTSGFRRVENADDVDKMISALYAGLGDQAISGSGGLLTGLTTNIGNRASYISQMVSESAAGLRSAAGNAALQILAAARQIETQYNQAVSGIANILTNTIGQLRSVENQCYTLIAYNTTAKHVCVAAPTGNTCTGVSGAQIRIATSTQFSQPIIDAQITPVATQVVQNVQKSTVALRQIDQLIAGVTNTTSLDAQRLALVQLDQLVSQGRLHVQADVTAAQQQQSAVAEAMSTLVEQTKTLWADNTDPTKGWCNVNNQAVIDMWDQRWR